MKRVYLVIYLLNAFLLFQATETSSTSGPETTVAEVVVGTTPSPEYVTDSSSDLQAAREQPRYSTDTSACLVEKISVDHETFTTEEDNTEDDEIPGDDISEIDASAGDKFFAIEHDAEPNIKHSNEVCNWVVSVSYLIIGWKYTTSTEHFYDTFSVVVR